MAGGTDTQPHILFVDDEQMLHDVLGRLFTRHGVKVTSCANAHQAIDELEEGGQEFDLVLTDFKMPEMNGLELLAYVRQEHPHLKVIMITAHANVQHAVSAMRSGAVDYMPKPFSTEELVERVQAQLEKSKEASGSAQEASSTAKRSRPHSKAKKKGSTTTQFIGEHESINELKALLPRVAESRAPVFIHGESGTGKEILSRLIHEKSKRSGEPYVTINCANLPSELVESHLFGHRKGAFTGAIEDMTGAFERADGGTLLLDEVTEVDLNVQAKLLRVLQEQEFQKVGTSETQKVDVRVIATSNRNLEEAVQANAFREDLYHRLAVFPLHVPPLRDRISDIPLLTQHFVEKYCELYDLPHKEIEPELLHHFQSYDWPGNVRQLENMVHRGVVMSADREVLEMGDVINDYFSDARGGARGDVQGAIAEGKVETIEDMERHMILQTLAQEGENQRSAAEKLGISARTIRNKLKRYRSEGYSI